MKRPIGMTPNEWAKFQRCPKIETPIIGAVVDKQVPSGSSGTVRTAAVQFISRSVDAVEQQQFKCDDDLQAAVDKQSIDASAGESETGPEDLPADGGAYVRDH